MDVAIRNGIVFENLLTVVHADVATRLATVCKQWYTHINTDSILWKRLIQVEKIEEPAFYNRDDDSHQWILGPPCEAKKIFINYKLTYYRLKKRQFKKYDILCDNFNYDFFEYDGKTLIIKFDDEFHVYRVINNNMSLFQKLDLSIYFINYRFSYVFTNTDYIMIILNQNYLITFKLINDKYEFYNQRSFEEYGTLNCYKPTGKLFDSKVLFGTYEGGSAPCRTFGLDITENRIVFHINNHVFIGHENGILYLYNKETGKVLLYNENYEVIYTVNDKFNTIAKIFVNDNYFHIVEQIQDSICISNWDKATGQIKSGSKMFEYDDYLEQFLVFTLNDIILICCFSDNGFARKAQITAYNCSFNVLWYHPIFPFAHICKGFSCRFNRLLTFREHKVTKETCIEFRDINNGTLIHTTTKLFESYWKFEKDIVVFREKIEFNEFIKPNLTLSLFR